MHGSNKLWIALAFTAGAGAGVGVYHLATRKNNEKYLERQRMAIRDYYENKRIVRADPTAPDPRQVAPAEPVEEVDEYRTEVVKYHTVDRDVVDLEKIRNQITTPAPKEEEVRTEHVTVLEGETVTKAEYDMSIPHPIEEDLMDPDELELWDVLTITYYDVDDTLVDEAEDAIDDTDEYIGEEAMTILRNDARVDRLMVRNPRLRCFFEVLRVPSSYADFIIEKSPVGKGNA